jgi:Zn-finger nucleic acid-binding protein
MARRCGAWYGSSNMKSASYASAEMALRRKPSTGGSLMKCPKCKQVELGPEPVEQIVVDRCPECHGVWCDANELEKVVAARPRELLQEDARFDPLSNEEETQLECPRCPGARMIKLNSRLRPGTIVDSCTVCFGAWLDAGELSKLSDEGLLGRIRRLFGR